MSLFPFDQTGLNPANRIVGESHTVSAINGITHAYIVPRNAPYFKESLTVVNAATGDILEPNVDYEWTHHFGEADNHLARKVYGSFTFLNPNTTGRFNISYQTLGGDFVTNFTQAINNGFDALADLRNADWSELSGVPPVFPPTSHTQPVTDILGVQQFIDIMHQIKEGVTDPNNRLTLDDVQDLTPGFIVPFLAGLQSISAAITAQTYAQNLPFHSFAAASTQTSLGAKAENIWFDIAELTVPMTGTYQHDWKTTRRPYDENIRMETRFLYNGAAITNSSHNGGFTAMAKNAKVKLQARVIGGSTSNFYLTRDADPTTFSIVRVGM